MQKMNRIIYVRPIPMGPSEDCSFGIIQFRNLGLFVFGTGGVHVTPPQGCIDQFMETEAFPNLAMACDDSSWHWSFPLK